MVNIYFCSQSCGCFLKSSKFIKRAKIISKRHKNELNSVNGLRSQTLAYFKGVQTDACRVNISCALSLNTYRGFGIIFSTVFCFFFSVLRFSVVAFTTLPWRHHALLLFWIVVPALLCGRGCSISEHVVLLLCCDWLRQVSGSLWISELQWRHCGDAALSWAALSFQHRSS